MAPTRLRLAAVAMLVVVACVQSYYVPVFVMLPLNILSNSNEVQYPEQLAQWFTELKNGGVDGVMSDVWWGLVEQEGPQQYNWTGYQTIISMVQEAGLKMQVVMSFHSCGGNQGDACNIPLPPWVLKVGQSNPSIFYTDQQGSPDQEYLSCGIDNEQVILGRSALQIYGDYMDSFATNFAQYIPSTISTIEIGMGPAGEMRYPSYQLSKWTFPGIGEFQCYDKYLLAQLAAAANATGQPQWGHGGPDDAGTYDSTPTQTGFFSDNNFDNWQSAYGQFFLGWYSQVLINHGDAVLSQAQNAFGKYGVEIAAKIAGIHWWYLTDSHAAEATAGYYNVAGHDGYAAISAMLAKHNATFCFTCLEMTDQQQPPSCDCGPVELVEQTEVDAKAAGLFYDGENALPIYSTSQYQQVEYEAGRNGPIHGFTYLRLTPGLFNSGNWTQFRTFVQNMHTLE